MADINLDTIPLAIVNRLAELDSRIKGIETLNERDAAEMAGLRDQIAHIKSRIEARVPDLNDILGQRDTLAFAIKAYQDEAPKPGAASSAQLTAVGLAVPPPSASAVTPLKERVFDAVRSAGYPIRAGEIARGLGLRAATSVSRHIGMLSEDHRIVAAPEGGWLAASGKE